MSGAQKRAVGELTLILRPNFMGTRMGGSDGRVGRWASEEEDGRCLAGSAKCFPAGAPSSRNHDRRARDSGKRASSPTVSDLRSPYKYTLRSHHSFLRSPHPAPRPDASESRARGSPADALLLAAPRYLSTPPLYPAWLPYNVSRIHGETTAVVLKNAGGQRGDCCRQCSPN